MSSANQQELQIIRAFSSVDVPERVLRDSNIKELIKGMVDDQDTVQSDAQRLERLRQEKKDGNIIGNWWNDREDNVQDAQIDLNKSIGRLTQKSSQLLIVNTAISKILSDQQNILLQQQKVLKQQTETLEVQNTRILEQQVQLGQQQDAINFANQGLMDAKGLTQEQAKELVGCVKLVKEAENRIGVANQTLKSGLELQVHNSIGQCLEQLDAGFLKQDQQHHAFEQSLSNAFSAQSQHTQAELERSTNSIAEFKETLTQKTQVHIQAMLEKAVAQDVVMEQLRGAVSDQLESNQQDLTATLSKESQALEETIQTFIRKTDVALQKHVQTQTAQHKALVDNQQSLTAELECKAEALTDLNYRLENLQNSSGKARLALYATTCLALAALGWQIAKHFALI